MPSSDELAARHGMDRERAARALSPEADLRRRVEALEERVDALASIARRLLEALNGPDVDTEQRGDLGRLQAAGEVSADRPAL